MEEEPRGSGFEEQNKKALLATFGDQHKLARDDKQVPTESEDVSLLTNEVAEVAGLGLGAVKGNEEGRWSFSRHFFTTMFSSFVSIAQK